MKKIRLLIALALIAVAQSSCSDKQDADREKIVTMTIYPETGYGASIMSDIITEPLVFSDSDDGEKRLLIDIITQGFDFVYERGYQYTLKVKKIWMHEPPQDVSSIKYEFVQLLSKEKVIIEDSEKAMKLFVAAETVQFMPSYPTQYGEGCIPQIYQALKVKETGTNNWMALMNIEGFEFEVGYEYVINVLKTTTAEPYSIQYKLINIESKTLKQ
jgi:hypothetical protein